MARETKRLFFLSSLGSAKVHSNVYGLMTFEKKGKKLFFSFSIIFFSQVTHRLVSLLLSLLFFSGVAQMKWLQQQGCKTSLRSSSFFPASTSSFLFGLKISFSTFLPTLFILFNGLPDNLTFYSMAFFLFVNDGCVLQWGFAPFSAGRITTSLNSVDSISKERDLLLLKYRRMLKKKNIRVSYKRVNIPLADCYSNDNLYGGTN